MTHHPRRSSAALGAVVLTLALAACGGEASGPAGRTTPQEPAAAGTDADDSTLDPCGLLTIEELEALNGSDLEPTGPATTQARGRKCAWSASDGSPAITISTWHGPEFFADVPEADHLPGLGDANYAEPTINTVTFVQGGEVFLVFGGESEATARAISASL